MWRRGFVYSTNPLAKYMAKAFGRDIHPLAQKQGPVRLGGYLETDKPMERNYLFVSAAAWLILCFCAFPAAPSAVASGTESIRWKQVTEAQIKVDGKVPLTWNL